jgi:hypothetical protein
MIDVLYEHFSLGRSTNDLMVAERRDVDKLLRASNRPGDTRASIHCTGTRTKSEAYPSGVSSPHMLIRPSSRRIAQVSEPPDPAGTVHTASICPSSLPVLTSLITR